MPGYWEAGQSCVLRGIANYQVWSAKSVIVVKDQPDETILLLPPGAQCAYPEGYWRWGHWVQDKNCLQRTRWQEARSDHIPLREWTWHTNRVLMFLEPEKFYSCCLAWKHASDQFNFYYINFQLPYQRSHCGFDTLDLDLDIIIDPQYQWRWKDEGDYREGIQEGGIRAEWVKGIEQSQAEVLDRINKRRYPLDGSWLVWRPAPAWGPPTLPQNWQVV